MRKCPKAMALVLLAHGSRSPELGRAMRKLVTGLSTLHPGLEVKAAFLSLRRPGLERTLADLMAAGAKEIRVLPLFLLPGKHLKEIPALFRAQARRDGVSLRLLPAIGSHPDFPAFLLAAARL